MIVLTLQGLSFEEKSNRTATWCPTTQPTCLVEQVREVDTHSVHKHEQIPLIFQAQLSEEKVTAAQILASLPNRALSVTSTPSLNHFLSMSRLTDVAIQQK